MRPWLTRHACNGMIDVDNHDAVLDLSAFPKPHTPWRRNRNQSKNRVPYLLVLTPAVVKTTFWSWCLIAPSNPAVTVIWAAETPISCVTQLVVPLISSKRCAFNKHHDARYSWWGATSLAWRWIVCWARLPSFRDSSVKNFWWAQLILAPVFSLSPESFRETALEVSLPPTSAAPLDEADLAAWMVDQSAKTWSSGTSASASSVEMDSVRLLSAMDQMNSSTNGSRLLMA